MDNAVSQKKHSIIMAKGLSKSGSKSSQPHQIRLIGGQWKRSLLPVLNVTGLRPTTDRVRETVFNWLTHLLDGNWSSVSCLDLCAGSGALGFEAASRGAKSVYCIDTDRGVIQHLNQAKEKLHADQITILQGDAKVKAKVAQAMNQQPFELIFVDPPYHHDWLPQLLPLCASLLTEQGVIYVEAEFDLSTIDAPWMEAWTIVRADKAGMVFYHLLQRKSS